MAGENVGSIYYTVEADLSSIVNSNQSLDGSLKKTEQALGKNEQAFKKTANAATDAGNKMKPMSAAIKNIGSESLTAGQHILKFTTLLGGLAALSFGRTILEMANAYNEYAERIKMATKSQEEYELVQARLLDTANRTYRSLSESQEMYVRTSGTLKSLGYSTDQVLDITDSLSYAFVKNAASNDRAAGAVSAYAKAMNKGKIEADAWETIIAAIPSVIDDIAEATGKSTTEIQKLGAEGKLATEALNTGLANSLEKNRAAADAMGTTINDAFRQFGNNLSKFAGDADQATGVSQAFSDSIIFLGKHIDSLVTAIAILGGATLAKYVAGLASAALAQVKQTVQTANAVVEERRLALAQLETARASLAKAQALNASGGAASNMAARMEAATAAEARYQAVTTKTGTAMKGVLGLLGGPVGIIATLGLAALSFVDFGKGADEAGKSLLNMQDPIDQVIAKLQTLNKMQLATEIGLLEGKEKDQMAEAQQAMIDFIANLEISRQGGAKAVAGLRGDMREQLVGIISDTTMTQEQLSTALTDLITVWAQQGVIAKGSEQATLAAANAFVKVQAEANMTGDALAAANERMEQFKTGAKAAATAAKAMADLDPGMDKWDEYLKKLIQARDQIGMNARQLGEYKAAQEGANAVQKLMSGIITAQADEFRNLQKAIEDKDAKAAEAAKSNIRNLDIERQRVALLAQQMASVMAAASAFAKAGVSGDVAAGALLAMNEGFAKRARQLSASPEIEAQINRVYKNTTPGKGSGGKKSKGGGGGKSETQRAMEQDAAAIQKAREKLAELTATANELAAVKAKNELSKFATQADIDTLTKLNEQIARQTELKKLQEKVGDDPLKYIRGTMSPADTANDPYSSYDDDIEAEQQRYADQLTRLTEALEAKKIVQEQYNAEYERMQQQHQDRMNQIDQARMEVALGTASQGFGQLASALKDSQGEQSAAYKAMFVASKAFAIAQAGLNLGTALGNAWQLPWPANLAALGVAAASMGTIISSIQAVSMGGGRQYGGGVDPSKMYRVNEGGKPELLNTPQGQFLLPNQRGQVVSNKDASQGGGGSPTQVIVQVMQNTERAGTVQRQQDNGREFIKVFVADLNGGGEASQAIEQTYGVRRQGR